MALTIGELVGFIRADGSDFERNLARSQLRMEGFRVDVNGRLRDLRGRFVRDTAIMGRAVADSFSEAEQAGTRITTVYSSVADAQSRTFRARMERMQEAGRQFADRIGNSFSRVGAAWGRINFDRLKPMASGFLSVATSVGTMAAKLGTIAPVAAGAAAAVGAVAPAAALAVSGLIAVKLASTALKLGMVGVSDAVSSALDPEKAADFEKALTKLAPNAQSFARQVKALAPEFRALQQSVQNRLFQGFDGLLKGMATTTLPVLRNGLTNTAGALNLMGKNIGNTAIGLSKSGALGQAISGANTGLYNLSRVPSQIMQGLVQVGAAAAPAFGQLTQAAGGAFDRLAEGMQRAFDSGAMQRAIETAVSVLGDLFTVLGNLGSIFASVFQAAQVSGGGLIGTLKEITGALATAFASPGVQAGLKAIFETMGTLASTVGPLLGQALQAIAPVFTALGPPIQTLIKALGQALAPVIKALGPVLESAAKAFGALIVAVSPILPVIGQLVASLLPVLAPLFDSIAVVIKALAPVVATLATTLGATLAPIITALTPIIASLAQSMGGQLALVIGMVGDLIVQLSPTLIKLGGIFGELLTALGPVIEQLSLLAMDVLADLMPMIQPIIGLIAQLAAIFADELAAIIRTVVVPALTMVTALLSGDFDKAWKAAKDLVRGAVDTIGRWISELPGKAWAALSSLGSKLGSRMQDAGNQLKAAASRKIAEAVAEVKQLPGKAGRALGDLGSRLYESGRALVRGFINGIRSMISAAGSAASDLVSKVKNFLPSSPAKEGPLSGKGYSLYSGRALADSFAEGIGDRQSAVRNAMAGMVRAAQMSTASLTAGASLPGMSLGAPSMGMRGYGAAGAATVQPIVIELHGDGLKDTITRIVKNQGRGDVQLAFGQ
ncbi:phage tail protein [Streptomyces cinereoruber]|uniref:phage tail protein n=1 Tax=Streptomyces cinereoruber TaxID=67260 RepID=UPI003666F179